MLTYFRYMKNADMVDLGQDYAAWKRLVMLVPATGTLWTTVIYDCSNAPNLEETDKTIGGIGEVCHQDEHNGAVVSLPMPYQGLTLTRQLTLTRRVEEGSKTNSSRSSSTVSKRSACISRGRVGMLMTSGHPLLVHSCARVQR